MVRLLNPPSPDLPLFLFSPNSTPTLLSPSRRLTLLHLSPTTLSLRKESSCSLLISPPVLPFLCFHRTLWFHLMISDWACARDQAVKASTTLLSSCYYSWFDILPESGLLNAVSKPGWAGYAIYQGFFFSNPANIATRQWPPHLQTRPGSWGRRFLFLYLILMLLVLQDFVSSMI